MKINMLFCSVGRRGKLLQNFRPLLNKNGGKLVVTDNNETAPALYFSDHQYLVPKITDENYINHILEICKKENIKAITTLIDPEISLLANNRAIFIEAGILPLCPSVHSAELCFDKYAMYQYLSEKGIKTTLTYDSLESFMRGLEKKEIQFPVFIKPRSGSGSVGAQKINSLEDLNKALACTTDDYIIQELMEGDDIDVDVYVDCISQKPVSIFSKRKLETKIGGANKTISFKDQKLVEIVQDCLQHFEFYGPIDIDFFYCNGTYYLSEINPRFGGAYIHAFGAGVNFLDLIINNIQGIENKPHFLDYESDILMMMYDDIIIKHKSDLAQ